MAGDNKQLRFTISPTNLKLLEKWADFHGKTPGEFAGQIIASRLESNSELILKLEGIQRNLAEQPEIMGDEIESS